jgi:hypothetical protein
LNVTEVAPARPVPLMVTAVPTTPLVGENPVMLGAGPAVTVNALALTAVPPAVVTAMGPLVAAVGTVALICVEDTTL